MQLRPDRLLTIYFIQPFGSIRKLEKGFKIPILMYHSISDDPENGVGSFFKINTPPKIFSEQMAYIYENNYSVIELKEAVERLSAGEIDENKFVVLTFDDGYRDFYTQAIGVLKKYGFAATVFLPTSLMDHQGKVGLKGKEHLSWKEVGELQKEDISFGSHTIHHTQLKRLGKKEIEYEIKYSRERIEEAIGKPVQSFSYPYAFPQEDGEFKKYIRNILEECGYKQGVTTMIGRSGKGDDCLLLKRIPINGADDLHFFKAKLEGGYDWFMQPQHLYKYLSKGFKSRSGWKP